MLAKKKRIGDTSNYIAEYKYDGTRAIAIINKEIRLINRRNFNISYRFPEVVEELNQFESCILDGEIVVLLNGKPNFNLLQRREVDDKLKIEVLSKLHPATYVVFDVLSYKGRDLKKLKLIERKEMLNEIFKNKKLKHIKKIEYFENFNIEKLMKEAINKGFEGIVLKKKDSPYIEGRSDYWIKVKKSKDVDAIVIGYVSEKEEISSLVLALKDKEKYVIIGKVRAGLSEKEIEKFKEKVEEDKSIANKIANREKIKEFEEKGKVTLVKPKVVAKVKFLEVTSNFQLRAPVFIGFREDKRIEECSIDQLKEA